MPLVLIALIVILLYKLAIIDLVINLLKFILKTFGWVIGLLILLTIFKYPILWILEELAGGLL